MASRATESLFTANTADAALQHEIEQFLYYEAAVLDARRYPDWLDLLSEDCSYYMPTRYNRTRREMEHEFSHANEVAHFDDDKASLRVRVKRLLTGQAWAEDPPSRTRHMVTNVRIDRRSANELQVFCNFHVYRSRLERDVETFVGERHDTLRRHSAAPGWQIVRRVILLDQTVLLAKNISIFL
jgi:3-phenylpropionate/cinnamic acid dioxygenase small subunit